MSEQADTLPVSEHDATAEAALAAEQSAFTVATLRAQVEYLSERVAILAGENARLKHQGQFNEE